MSIDLKAATWRKSSLSNGTGGNCVEVADDVSAFVPVRDSKDPSMGHLILGAASWAAFTATLRA